RRGRNGTHQSGPVHTVPRVLSRSQSRWRTVTAGWCVLRARNASIRAIYYAQQIRADDNGDDVPS
uniref:Uncharacterized protein n=1 Tax=Anopheles quadriannulatus TaxID=34691 RepID=A0A182WRA7_ANOQN